MKELIRSPLFYVGDKYKILRQILVHFPNKITSFVEPFVGGGSVFLNVDAENYKLNDIDAHLINLHKFLKRSNYKRLITEVEKNIEKYSLSKSYISDIVPGKLKKKYIKTYYAKFNKKAYISMRDDFNIEHNNYILLYMLLIYGFNRMLRFNSSGDFNIPVGNVDFNNNVLTCLQAYFSVIKKKKIKFNNKDYRDFLANLELARTDFVYFDPPYLISSSEYNKYWNEDMEEELLSYIDKLSSKKIKWALSNVTVYRGKKNKVLEKWMSRYNVHNIKSNYISFNDNTVKKFEEVLISNV